MRNGLTRGLSRSGRYCISAAWNGVKGVSRVAQEGSASQLVTLPSFLSGIREALKTPRLTRYDSERVAALTYSEMPLSTISSLPGALVSAIHSLQYSIVTGRCFASRY